MHNLTGNFFDVFLHLLGLVFVLQTEGFVLQDLLLGLFLGLCRHLILLLGGHL